MIYILNHKHIEGQPPAAGFTPLTLFPGNPRLPVRLRQLRGLSAGHWRTPAFFPMRRDHRSHWRIRPIGFGWRRPHGPPTYGVTNFCRRSSPLQSWLSPMFGFWYDNWWWAAGPAWIEWKPTYPQGPVLSMFTHWHRVRRLIGKLGLN